MKHDGLVTTTSVEATSSLGLHRVKMSLTSSRSFNVLDLKMQNDKKNNIILVEKDHQQIARFVIEDHPDINVELHPDGTIAIESPYQILEYSLILTIFLYITSNAHFE